MIDSTELARSRVVAAVGEENVPFLAQVLDDVRVPDGQVIVREGDEARRMYFVLEGRARIERGKIELRAVGPGDHFGELGLIARRKRSTTVVALSPMRLACLTRASLAELELVHPSAALRFVRAVVADLGERLMDVTDDLGTFLRARSLPRRDAITVHRGDEVLDVPTGTRLRALLPKDVAGDLVVAGLTDRKPVSLDTPIFAECSIAPLTLGSWEGRDVYRRSACLVLLEAARAEAPDVRIRVGQSVSSAQLIEVAGGANRDALAPRLAAAMRQIIARDAPFLEELWGVEEARVYFAEQGWDETTQLLRMERTQTVRVARCGDVVALSHGPLLPTTRAIGDFELRPHPGGLILDFGAVLRRHLDVGYADVPDPAVLETAAPRYGGAMACEHRAWLAAMGVSSVGELNAMCIDRQVSDLIRVSEGFHEKSIGKLADLIAARGRGVRVIAVAGPSSSGKTTFIKRLTVQLRINGLNPVGLSLDDYYVDREKTLRDAQGEYDYEAVEALSRELLQSQFARLLAGETVRVARFDFVRGTSAPEGGSALTLRDRDVLLVEGIHALNPSLFGAAVQPAELFRIFIHPAVALPFDRLSVLAAADVRLLRRIVRDRHTRGHDAAANILRWPAVRRGERLHIFPYLAHADAVFDSSLAYDVSVLKVFAERYLLEVPPGHAAFTTAHRLRQLLDSFVAIYPDHVPPTSILREFIGGSGFEY